MTVTFGCMTRYVRPTDGKWEHPAVSELSEVARTVVWGSFTFKWGMISLNAEDGS